MVRAMNIALRQARMTRDQFFAWAQARDGRYEFDGCGPVAMTGGSINHNRITLNLHRALFSRLQGSGCETFGPDAGVSTIGDTVRYPDAVATCSPVDGGTHLIPNPVVVFEVVSPSSGRMDRIVKVREYRTVGSIRRYVILESLSIALTVLWRKDAGDWTLTTLVAGDMMPVPELGTEIPLAELYAATGLAETIEGQAPEA
jgi:Uma2 family endonuclease